MTYEIRVSTREEFIEIVYGLITKGLCFLAMASEDEYIIELTGGY